jgi:glycyl-tRNA synthetase beta chain
MAKVRSATGAPATLLVELLTEELPPKSLLKLAQVFLEALASGLSGSSLVAFPHRGHCFASPRRLGVLIPNVSAKATTVHAETSGPPVAAGAKAAEGFAKKHGLTVDALKRVSTPKGEVYVANYTVGGAKLDDVLAQKVDTALKALPVPKVMRWGEGDAQFARPVHGLVMMHGMRVIPGTVLGVASGNVTSGHRFIGDPRIRLTSADDYETILRKKGSVIADFEARKGEIDRQLHAEAKRQGASLGEYRELLDEVTALVEFPSVYVCEFDAAFLGVPHECLILTMRQNQKYFPLFERKGKLLPKFLVVSNMRVKDPAAIVAGNERVVRPRLDDARFFYDQDRKVRLESRVPRLASVVYHNKLGTQLERVQRIKLLSGAIARSLRADLLQVERAAELAKADLLTGMVGEFPELQGAMGRYYALHDGEKREVADAIGEQYRPRFSGDELPRRPVSAAVAIADKLDALAGLFSIGEQPTGEKDPFGLRRAALGVIRILAENQLPLSLRELVDAAFEPFKNKRQGDLITFFTERLRGYFQDRGYTANEVEAVLSVSKSAISVMPKQLEALRSFSALGEAASLVAANKRIANILRQAEGKGESFVDVNAAALKEPAEIALSEALRAASRTAMPLFDSGDFAGYLKTFAMLKGPVDLFFDKVMVMVEDSELRRNRLALLADMRKAMNRFSDISKLAS